MSRIRDVSLDEQLHDFGKMPVRLSEYRLISLSAPARPSGRECLGWSWQLSLRPFRCPLSTRAATALLLFLSVYLFRILQVTRCKVMPFADIRDASAGLTVRSALENCAWEGRWASSLSGWMEGFS